MSALNGNPNMIRVLIEPNTNIPQLIIVYD